MHIFLPEFFQSDMFMSHLSLKIREFELKCFKTVVNVCGMSSSHTILKHRVFQFQKSSELHAVFNSPADVFVDRLFIQAQIICNLAVRTPPKC